MDKLEVMQNQKKEDRLLNNVNGRLVNKLKEIGKKTDKKLSLMKDLNNNYLNEFKYDGKELSAWVKVHGVEVGDHGGGEKEYFVSLYDLAKCPDLLKAVSSVEKQKGIKFSINDTVSLNDCFTLSGAKEKINPVLIIMDRGLKDIIKIKEILKDIVKDLKILLNPDYDILINNMTYDIILETKNQSAKQNIISLSPEFLNKIKEIQEYFQSNLSKIYEKIDNAILQQRQNAEDIYKTDLQRIESLRKKL